MRYKSVLSVIFVFVMATGIAAADALDKLPRNVRLELLESLYIVNGHPASAKIGIAKTHLNKAEYQELKSIFGWGKLGVDHENYKCAGAGQCNTSPQWICDPAHCGNGVSLGGLVSTLSAAERSEFLMSLRFHEGRVTQVELGKFRARLTPAALSEIEKMQR